MMKKSYANSRHGQIHLRIYGEPGSASRNPLLCLHPCPYSGVFFDTIAPLLAEGRLIIAADYPGYGASDRGSDHPSIAEYAEAMSDAMEDKGFSGPMDLLGFHTGCLVAVEMSLLAPDMCGHLALVDVPYFEEGKRKELLAATTRPKVFTRETACLEDVWTRNVSNRWDVIPFSKSLQLFIEELRTGENVNRGFHAAFTYDCDEKFALVSSPVMVLATNSSLLEPSRLAAQLIAGSKIVECPSVEAPAFETGARIIADEVELFLAATHDFGVY